jgi:endonuclease/exonuclease/phosphatase family metal-dependent hydrolase
MWGKFGPYRERWAYAVRHVPRAGADILCVQEGGDEACVRELAEAAGMRVLQSDTGSTGLAILSRLKPEKGGLVEYRTRSELEPYVRKFQWAEFRDGAGSFLVTNTHLAWKKGDDATRSGQAGELGAFLDERKRPAVLCGDFNCEYGSGPLAALRKRGYRDLLEGTPDERKPSWDNANPFIQSHPDKFPDRRIDLILADPAFLKAKPLRSARIAFTEPDPDTGLFASDHWGVVAEFA